MIHILIKTERRNAPRELALEYQGQLHIIGEKITDYTNILYAAEWDGISSYINVLKNELPDGIKMAYAGWPMITREEYEELYPPADNNLS